MTYNVFGGTLNPTLLLLLEHTCTDSLRGRLSTCADDNINSWCKYLNASKNEAIWFGSKSNLAQLNKRDRSIKVCSSIIQATAVVRDLGLLLESELSMKQHVTKVATAFARSADESAVK